MTDHANHAPGFAPLRPDDPAEIGGYRIVGRVGTGGMGTVYAGLRGEGLGRRRYVAVKVIREELAEDPDFHKRFTREVRNLRRLTEAGCRSVPEFLDAGQEGDGPWLATEFVHGLTLSAYVKEHGPLPPNLLLGLAAGVADALFSMHTIGIVHRDLKPGNVMLAPDRPMVLDLGIARAVDETALTRTGGLVGTPGWIAPEVLRGGAASHPADMFAWGCMVAFAATGREPYGSGSAESITHRVLNEQPDLTGVPESLLPLVTAALDRRSILRPDSYRAASTLVSPELGRQPKLGEISDAVGVLLEREWQGVEVDPPPAPPRRVSKPLVVAGAAVLLLGAVGGGVWAAGGLGTDGEGDTGEEGSEEAQEAGEEWVPPEPTPFDTNAEWLAEVITSSNDLPTFQATPDSYDTLFHLSVVSVEEAAAEEVDGEAGGGAAGDTDGEAAGETDGEAGGVRVTLLVENLIEGYDLPDLFSVTTPEGPIHPQEDPGTVAVGDELVLTFPDAPERGLLTFGDPDQVPGVSGIPPVSQCYDAPAGTVSVEYEDCAQRGQGPTR